MYLCYVVDIHTHTHTAAAADDDNKLCDHTLYVLYGYRDQRFERFVSFQKSFQKITKTVLAPKIMDFLSYPDLSNSLDQALLAIAVIFTLSYVFRSRVPILALACRFRSRFSKIFIHSHTHTHTHTELEPQIFSTFHF